MDFDDDILLEKNHVGKHERQVMDPFIPREQRRQADYDLTHLYDREKVSIVKKTREGFDYVYGDTQDRVFAGGPFIGNVVSEKCAHRVIPIYDDGGDEWPEGDPENHIPDPGRPIWHSYEFNHLRPWHVKGEQITRHFNHRKELLATGVAYATDNDVLDAIRNDEFVPFP